MPIRRDIRYKPVRDLANRIQALTVRLRNKAALVAGDGAPGRNLTALKNTLAQMSELHELLIGAEREALSDG